MEDKIRQTLSLYKEFDSPVVVFHNRNEIPCNSVPHLHSQVEFCYNITGAGGMFIDKQLYACTGHDLFFIPATCVHKTLVDKEIYYERCIINIDPKLIHEINTSSFLHRPLGWMEEESSRKPAKVNLTEDQHRVFVSLVDRYQLEKDSELKRFACLMEILDFLSGCFTDPRCFNAELKQPGTLSEQALVEIEKDFRNIRISQLSGKLYISSSHLSEQFRQDCGITLGQYLIIRKIAEAKKYLYLGIPVQQACELAGFSSYSNFIRTFRKYEGCSPGKLNSLSDPL